MMFVSAPPMALAALLAAAATPYLSAQSAPEPPPASQAPQQGKGKVVFSRSTDENGQTVSTTGPAAKGAAGTMVAAPVADDAEREALAFTAYDLDVRLRPADEQIAVRAAVTVRNDGKTPLAHIPLQISSSLEWERIRVRGRDVAFQVATLNSDADHTGQLHEATLNLAEPLAPGSTLQLDLTYSGAILPSGKRLVNIGTPADTALHSDWDGVGVEFTGLRGFGNVVWYPVSSVPVILGDGARLFDEMGEQKLHMRDVGFKLRLTDEFPTGHPPTVALVNGRPLDLSITAGNEEISGVAGAVLEETKLGFEAPSLFVAIRKPVEATHTTVWTLPVDEPAVLGWSSAATEVNPFIEGWLGQRPGAKLEILDLPDPDDAPYETGSMLATPIHQATAERLDGAMAHALAHAYVAISKAPPAWLDEGVAGFMGALWLEKQSGRTRALESLEAERSALALAEPASPGESPGQPLAEAISPVYYRTKATYVLWMLRDIAGDAALSAALRAYDPAIHSAKTPDGGAGGFEKLIEQAGTRHDLAWFFADWVDADKGLPDLAIDSVFPTPGESGNTLVGVNLSNAGYASVEIPVTVRTEGTEVTKRVVVPARGKAIQRILIQGRPTEVQANDGTVPETQASVHIKKFGDGDDNSPGDAPPPATTPPAR